MEKFWCENQREDDEGIYCIAHLYEGRVLDCPYASKEEMIFLTKQCHDYREKVK